jgi:hypothetical protein
MARSRPDWYNKVSYATIEDAAVKLVSKHFAALLAAAGLGLTSVAPALAAPVIWTDWTSEATNSVKGSLNGIDVTFTGPYSFAQLGSGTNYWTEPVAGQEPYTASALVNNAPTAAELVALDGASTYSVTFATPIDNLIMALVSVGRTTIQVRYDFDQDFSVLSSGVGFWGGGVGSIVRSSATVMDGFEGHGALLFAGPVSTLTWTTTPNEFWHGFTFGVVEPIPEPSTYVLMLAGLLAMGFVARRRARA